MGGFRIPPPEPVTLLGRNGFGFGGGGGGGGIGFGGIGSSGGNGVIHVGSRSRKMTGECSSAKPAVAMRSLLLVGTVSHRPRGLMGRKIAYSSAGRKGPNLHRSKQARAVYR